MFKIKMNRRNTNKKVSVSTLSRADKSNNHCVLVFQIEGLSNVVHFSFLAQAK